MTFHTDVFVSDSVACVDAPVPAACATRDAECTLRLSPSHGGEPRSIRVRYALYGAIAEPKRAVDCFGTLFARRIDDGSLGLASGEALAHLRRLEVEGRAIREVRDGVWWFRAA